MKIFNITIRTAGQINRYCAIALTTLDAFMDAAEAQGDTPCGITVIPA